MEADLGSAGAIVKLVADIGLGGMSLALFFKLGQVVANHEIRITNLEDNRDESHPVRRKRRRAR